MQFQWQNRTITVEPRAVVALGGLVVGLVLLLVWSGSDSGDSDQTTVVQPVNHEVVSANNAALPVPVVRQTRLASIPEPLPELQEAEQPESAAEQPPVSEPLTAATAKAAKTEKLAAEKKAMQERIKLSLEARARYHKERLA